MGLKSGKIQDLSPLKVIAEHIQSGNYGNNPRRVHKKKEEDVSLILQGQKGNQNMPIQRRNYIPFQAQPSNPPIPKGGEVKCPRVFTPLGDSLENILTLLTTQKKITHLLPPASPNGQGFNAAQKCVYHDGAPGHDTQDCWALKHKIQDLIDNGEVVVTKLDQPNVQDNSLPLHKEEEVNMINWSTAQSSNFNCEASPIIKDEVDK